MKENYFLILLLLSPVLCEIDLFVNDTWSSGLIEIGNGNDMFYWLFKSRDKNPNAPLVVFFSGGPGSGSALFVLRTQGPAKLTDEKELVFNPYSWNNHSDLLYIDQPIGCGFSQRKEDICTDRECYSRDFFLIFPPICEAIS